MWFLLVALKDTELKYFENPEQQVSSLSIFIYGKITNVYILIMRLTWWFTLPKDFEPPFSPKS